MPGVLKRTASGAADVVEFVVCSRARSIRSRLLRAACRPCSRGPDRAGLPGSLQAPAAGRARCAYAVKAGFLPSRRDDLRPR
jgi:hypothetical protein